MQGLHEGCSIKYKPKIEVTNLKKFTAYIECWEEGSPVQWQKH